ncbi:MAG: tRNA (adenosine(37)-N6)-dimethylallyltransferase MiaA [Bacteroidetes bacterium]|nr:MAG: tRNA (adenosine(37)-N6)-dimethylallyltransferase MiaA [Bacteroidota bacterium]
MKTSVYDIISIMGATAGGKTSLAAHIAYEFDGEIISADSRQVYRGMDIGTGKDLEDFILKEKEIPYHLIDIAEAGYKYNVFEYQKDFLNVYKDLKKRNKLPILCGGTGMYIDAVLKGYKLINVPHDEDLKSKLEEKTDDELIEILKTNIELHNRSDTSNRKRLIRAVEIALYYQKHSDFDFSYPEIKSLNIQIVFDRNSRRKRITQRLKERLQTGMIEEVENLINKNVPVETLKYYGLEYKFITEYILGELSYEEMFSKLEIAIYQFSKRQMTWFRKMEKDGYKIYKIDGYLPLEEKIRKVKQLFYQE